jgi:hypothetical protein
VWVVRAPDGPVGDDTTGKKSGRGAYLCLQTDCWQTALKRHALERALKTELSMADREALAAFGATHATLPVAGDGQERGNSCPDHSAEAAAGPVADAQVGPATTAAGGATIGADQAGLTSREATA